MNLIFKKTKKTTSLDGIINEFLTIKKPLISSKSLTRYKNYLTPMDIFFKEYFPPAHSDISQIRLIYINEFFDHQKTAVSWTPKTLNGSRSCIKSVFKYAIEEEYIQKNPLEKSKRFRLEQNGSIKFYSDEEMKQIFEAIDPFWRDPIEFLYLTGLRKAELLNLTWDNARITDIGSQITICSNKNWKTKTGKMRVIPLNQKAVAIVKKFQAEIKRMFSLTKKTRKYIPTNLITL